MLLLTKQFFFFLEREEGMANKIKKVRLHNGPLNHRWYDEWGGGNEILQGAWQSNTRVTSETDDERLESLEAERESEYSIYARVDRRKRATGIQQATILTL